MNLKRDYNYALIDTVHPHISAKLSVFWGYAEFVDYVDHLLHDSRDGKRQGFSPAVLSALTALLDAHHAEFPQYKPKVDLWGSSNKVR